MKTNLLLICVSLVLLTGCSTVQKAFEKQEDGTYQVKYLEQIESTADVISTATGIKWIEGVIGMVAGIAGTGMTWYMKGKNKKK